LRFGPREFEINFFLYYTSLDRCNSKFGGKTMTRPPILAVSGGDPAGIGPTVALRAARRLADSGLCTPVIFTHPSAVGRRGAGGSAARIRICGRIEEAGASEGKRQRVWVIPTADEGQRPFVTGRPSLEAAAVALESLRSATRAVMEGKADALVTGPVSKEWISRLEPFPGHTEWLACASGTPEEDLLMSFFGRRMAVATVTRHMALRHVPDSLGTGAILRAVALLAACLVHDFHRKHSTLAVCSLNPHASDGGLMGDEEERVLDPALRLAGRFLSAAGLRRRVSIVGPMGADAAMRLLVVGRIDACLAMYHDQAMIAAKVMEPYRCAGYSVGLPFVRTTPAHGTAYDIAGGRRISPESMVAAMMLAARIARSRGGLARRLHEIRRLVAQTLK
jgi:4-hydroxythreonine-4-phosphate dehydrogenase